MSEIDGGGPAFPVTPTDNSGQIGPTEYGLTKWTKTFLRKS